MIYKQNYKPQMNLQIKDMILNDGEYYNEKYIKDTIYIHHTAGSHRPDWTIHGWNTDRTIHGKQRRTATAFIIGGKSTSDGNTDWNGKILRAFPEEMWAAHLGVSKKYRNDLEKKSIGIEICNYGQLVLGSDGMFYNYVNRTVPKTDVYELSEPFRGYRYYHRYTDEQLNSLRRLLLYLSEKFEIDLKYGLKECMFDNKDSVPYFSNVREKQEWLQKNGFLGANLKPIVVDGVDGVNTQSAYDKAKRHPFERQESALYGQPGLWSHSNIRNDKFDCHPQPELIQMIRGL